MTLTTPTTRRLAAAGLATALAVATLSGCAEEAPTHEETTSSSTDAAPTTADSATATTAAPDGAPTTADAEQKTEEPADETSSPTSLESSDGSFEVEVPGGWEDAIDMLDEKGVLLAAKDTERVDDFFTNVVVTTEKSVKNLTASVADAAKELAGKDGDYELLDAIDVDGEDAPGYTLVREVKDTQVHQVQRWINHDDKLYVVTFSAVESQAEQTAPLLDEILGSWSWTG
ncbi:hypothetical protein [Ornithinimicrobium avium]|uniref:DUF1795 domain-containing protein n=1 Tax=Ornithinimicrobium avium TaxID=2283195 RepID=A0A345NRJ2_9MICO|nr:hypothetical protein [Ornithinimicrobium avium]AXH97650.1 hypothetical protein DV701_17405 [Ornithinimicrobium avium]